MKKLMIICGTLFLALASSAQSTPTSSMNADEANRLTGKTEPTYQGGKPYSQWVAEEKAKQQAANKSTTVALYKTSNTGLIDLPVQVKTEAPAKGPDKQVTTPVVAPQLEVVKVAELPVEPSMPLGGNAGGVPAQAFENKKPETIKIEGTSNDVKMLPQPSNKNGGGEGDMKAKQVEPKVIAKGTEKPIQSLPAPGPAPVSAKANGASNTSN